MQVINFKPVKTKKAGLKDEISFRITEIGPLDPALLNSNPPRKASLLTDVGSFRRLNAKELPAKVQSNSTLYVDVGVNPNAKVIDGNSGLIPATQVQVQSELDKAAAALQIKNAELSSAVVLRRKQNPEEAAKLGAPLEAFLADSITFCTKGATEVEEVVSPGVVQKKTIPGVLEICNDGQSLPYLFIGRPKQARVKQILEKDLVEISDANTFAGEKFLSIVCTDPSYIANAGSSIQSVYYFGIDKLVTPATTPFSIMVQAIVPPPNTSMPAVECLSPVVNNTPATALFKINKQNPPTLAEVIQAFRQSPGNDYLQVDVKSTSKEWSSASLLAAHRSQLKLGITFEFINAATGTPLPPNTILYTQQTYSGVLRIKNLDSTTINNLSLSIGSRDDVPKPSAGYENVFDFGPSAKGTITSLAAGATQEITLQFSPNSAFNNIMSTSNEVAFEIPILIKDNTNTRKWIDSFKFTISNLGSRIVEGFVVNTSILSAIAAAGGPTIESLVMKTNDNLPPKTDSTGSNANLDLVSSYIKLAGNPTKYYATSVVGDTRIANNTHMTMVGGTLYPSTTVGFSYKITFQQGYSMEVAYNSNTESTVRFTSPTDDISVSIISLNGYATEGFNLLNDQTLFSQAFTGPSLAVALPNGNLTFTKRSATIKVKPTSFSKADANGSLFSTDARQAIKSLALFHAVPGIPLLRKQKVGSDIPTLEDYCALIEQEVPLTNLFTPIAKDSGPPGQYLGNLDLSSLTVALYDADTTVMLIQQGEATPGTSVQYKLHKEPKPAEKSSGKVTQERIEIGDVDVTIKLTAPPARVPIRGNLVRGTTELALGIKIASSPGRLTPLGSGGANNAKSFQEKVNDTIARYSEKQTAGEYYFNFQAKNAQGQTINLNKYGTIRMFDEITILYQNEAGKMVKLQKTTIAGVRDATNTIALKDAISSLPPVGSNGLPPPVFVEIAQTPFNPARTYRIRVSGVDREFREKNI